MFGAEESTAAAPRIEHAADLQHAGLTVPKHVIDGRAAGKHGAAILERHPTIGPGLAEVDMQRLVDADHERDAGERVLIQLLPARIRLPRVKRRRREAAEEPAGLGLSEAPFRGDVEEDLDGTGTEARSLARIGQVGRLIEWVACDDGSCEKSRQAYLSNSRFIMLGFERWCKCN